MDLIRTNVPGTLSLGTLRELLEHLGHDAAILEGAEEGTFCRGMDLEALLEDDLDAALQVFSQTLARLEHDVLSVAIVDGVAAGGGVGLAAACTLVVATPRARFVLPELTLGLTPAAIWPTLRARVGARSLVAMATHACAIDAADAARLGLVDVVTPHPERFVKNLRRIDAGAHRRLRALSRRPVPAELERGRAAWIADARAQLDDPAVRRRVDRFQRGETPWP